MRAWEKDRGREGERERRDCENERERERDGERVYPHTAEITGQVRGLTNRHRLGRAATRTGGISGVTAAWLNYGAATRPYGHEAARCRTEP